jgi:hypothetical protein
VISYHNLTDPYLYTSTFLTNTHTFTHIYTHLHTHIYTHTHTFTHTHIYTHAFTRTSRIRTHDLKSFPHIIISIKSETRDKGKKFEPKNEKKKCSEITNFNLLRSVLQKFTLDRFFLIFHVFIGHNISFNDKRSNSNYFYNKLSCRSLLYANLSYI